jgi:ribosome-dependent ATPase
MSQAFSLYTELTVRQNLILHARLFDLPPQQGKSRVAELIQKFGLDSVADTLAQDIPLGIRQRLSLAVAVLHEPEILILDEPTSGVDPVARDGFWELMIRLSRDEGVTIFLSTHFMNEAARCDRMSMMHRGKVLAVGRPAELVKERKAPTLEAAFIGYLEDEAKKEKEASGDVVNEAFAEQSAADDQPTFEKGNGPKPGKFSLARVWAFARREAIEIRHDTVRLTFSVLGPLLLMIVFGYGISLDVNHLTFATFDEDQTAASRSYSDAFRGSEYYDERSPILSDTDLDRRLRNGELRFAIDIPPGFERDVEQGRQPAVSALIDAAVPFRAETARGYIEATHDRYNSELRDTKGLPPQQTPATIESRALYNQSFESVYAMVPGDIMLLLMLIPSMLTALSVVREKELGSIANFYAAPATKAEFLFGKQLPYIGIALVQFVSLVLLAVILFHVPIKGSVLTLGLAGVIYVLASTGFGLLLSVFASTQTAAIFAAAIIAILPAVQFSGMFVPTSSLTGGAWFASQIFPSTYFQSISVGTFTKALGFDTVWPSMLALAIIAMVYFSVSVLLLKKQEA